MRKFTEFKGYRSSVEYDPQTGQFVTTPAAEQIVVPQADEAEPSLAEIVPFPEPQKAVRQNRMAG